jgi:L-threonylcarbamoyladenylate synthase
MSNSFDFDDDLEQCLLTLADGGTILYPTDTIWGIGCDATNFDAVEKVFSIKNRSQKNPFIILVHSEAMLLKYVEEVPEIAYELIESADKPLTIIFPNAKKLAKNICSDDGSVAIRIVQEPFCKALIATLKKPIVSTSANLSNMPAPLLFSEINQEILMAVDYVVKFRQEERVQAHSSTIIKILPNNTLTYIRK